MFQFTRSDALDYIEKSKTITNLQYKAEDYLSDAIQATCLLVEEGLSLVFAHRSFQEYFAARFIAETNAEIQGKLIQKYAKHIEDDSVLGLLHEIRPEAVEKVLIIPAIEKFEKQMDLKDRVGPTHLLRFLKRNVNSIGFDERNRFFSATNDSTFSLIWFTLQRCGYLVDWKYSSGQVDPTNQPHVKEGHYQVADFSLRHAAFRHLALGEGVLSVRTLQASSTSRRH